MLPFIYVASEKVQYFKYCENFNKPIYARFWGELEENQLSKLNGRHFRVTYSNTGSAKGLYRLVKIEHFYLNQKQAIYDYKNTEFKDQQIQFSIASEINLDYNGDILQKIEFRDNNGNACRNSYGVSKYEYDLKGGDKFEEISYSLDASNNYILRDIPNENNLSFNLRHYYSSDARNRKIRVWKKIRDKSLGQEIQYYYKRDEYTRKTFYFHKNTNQRKIIEKNGCYRLEQTYESKNGFLTKKVSYDSKGDIIGLIELFDLIKNDDGNYEYISSFEDFENNPKRKGFQKGFSANNIVYSDDFLKLSKSYYNGYEDIYKRDRVGENLSSVKVMVIRELKGNLYKKFFQVYNRYGIKVNQLTLNSDGTTVAEKDVKVNFYSDENEYRVTNVEIRKKDKNQKLIKANILKVPKIVYFYDENGNMIKEQRFATESDMMGANMEFGDQYRFAFVPEIRNKFNLDGALIEKHIMGVDDKYFEVESRKHILFSSEFESDIYTRGYNAIKYTYGKYGTSEEYYKQLGEQEYLNTKASYALKLSSIKKNSKEDGFSYSVTKSLLDRAKNEFSLDFESSIVRTEKRYDKLHRLTEEINIHHNGTQIHKYYGYQDKSFPYPLFNSLYHRSEVDNVNIEGAPYHLIKYLMDHRGNTRNAKKYDIDGKIIVQRFLNNLAWTDYEYDHFNFIRSECYKDLDSNLITIKKWDYEEPINKITYEYDNRGNELKRTTYGLERRNSKVSHVPLDVWEFEYDDYDNPVKESTKFEGEYVKNSSGTYIQEFEYDDNRNVSVVFNRDKTGLPMKDNEGNYGVLYEYNDESLPVSKVYLGKDYDPERRLYYLATRGNIEKAKIKKEVYSYDRNGVMNRIAYFEEYDTLKARANDDGGISVELTRFNEDVYQEELKEYLDKDLNPTNGPNGYSKVELKYDKDGKRILEKYYVAKDKDQVLQFKGCNKECDYFMKVHHSEDGDSLISEFWTEENDNPVKSINEYGVHKIIMQNVQIQVKSKKTNRNIKRTSYSFYNLKKVKVNKMNIKSFAEVLIGGEIFDDFLSEPFAIHQVNMDYIGKDVYVSFLNNKGKLVGLEDEYGEKVKFIVMDKTMRFQRYATKYSLLKQ